MAIGGVVINFVAKTRDAVRDVDLFTRSVDRADDQLDGLDTALGQTKRTLSLTGAEAREAGGDLEHAERGFTELAQEVARTRSTMERDMRGMSGAVRGGAADVDRETSRMRTDMGEAGRETGAEFISNIAEGIGSGGGNLQDVVSGTLGGLTNLAATLTGPVGIAAGAAAAGIGLVFNTVRQQAEQAKARIGELVGGLEDVEDQSKKAAEAKIFEIWLEQMKEMPDQLQQTVSVLKTAGVEAGTFSKAIAGNKAAQDQVRTAIQKTGGDIIANQVKTGQLTAEQQAYLDAMGPVLGLLDQQNSDLTAAKGLHEDINWLQGESKGKQKAVTEETKRTRGEARGLGQDLDDATKDRSVKVKVDYQERWVKGPSGGGAPSSGYPHAAGYATTPAPQATPMQPPTVIVTEEQVYRAVSSLLMRGDARNGRTVRIA